MHRRTFLSVAGTSIAAATPGQATTQADFDWEDIGDEALTRAVSWVSALAELGIGATQEALVECATAIAPVYQDTEALQLQSLGLSSDWTTAYVNSYRAITSITQTLSAELGIDVPWPRFLGGLGKASSVGGVILAVAAIGEASVPLHRASEQQGLSAANIETDKFVDLIFALLSLAIEIAFFAVPISYRFAWRGTRYISTRTLFRVRKFLPTPYRDGLTALAMIVLHWSQRLGVELVFANLQIGAETVAGGFDWLQRLNASVRVDDRFDPEGIGAGSLWETDPAVLRDAMVGLLEQFPVLVELVGDTLVQALESADQ